MVDLASSVIGLLTGGGGRGPGAPAVKPHRDANDTEVRLITAGPGARVDTVPPSVTRRPGTAEAVVLGLAAMLGAGVFGVWGPAVGRGGGVAADGGRRRRGRGAVRRRGGLGRGAGLSGRAARCGGTALLPAGLARLAGLAHLVGRAAAGGHGGRPCSAATCCRTGRCSPPSGSSWWCTGLAVAGVTWTVAERWALVGGVGVVLFVAVLGRARRRRAEAIESAPRLGGGAGRRPVGPASAGAPGLLTAAGLLFFAFAGFARLFPLGAELRDPRRAVGLTLGVALLVYLAVAVALLCGLGVDAVATAAARSPRSSTRAGRPALGVLVRIGAAVACGSALLAVLAGGSRTAATMAGAGELPRVLATPGRGGSLWRADLVGGAAAVVVVATLRAGRRADRRGVRAAGALRAGRHGRACCCRRRRGAGRVGVRDRCRCCACCWRCCCRCGGSRSRR